LHPASSSKSLGQIVMFEGAGHPLDFGRARAVLLRDRGPVAHHLRNLANDLSPRGSGRPQKRIQEIAETRVRYGYRLLHVLLRREGWDVNAKRVYRLYKELGRTHPIEAAN
jgi:hypothetical protein